MDEAALRAMMPSSFGKRRGNGGRGVAPAGQERQGGQGGQGAGEGNSSVQSTLLGKRAQVEERVEEEEDDGLMPEERAANREAEERERERRARGLASDDDSDDSDDEPEIGPPAPPSASTPTSAPIAPASSYPPSALPPTTHIAHFTGTHTKHLSALAVDASGSRFALGSYDTHLSLYDFGGMTSILQPFRLFPVEENHPILDLSFNSNSSHLLVISSTSEAKVFTRDGAEIGTCKKGDPYLRDMRNTKGHVSSLTCGMFDPSDVGRFFTGGSDSTVRLWNVETMHAGQQNVIVLKSKLRGGRTKVTALQRDSTHRLWATGEDGVLNMWDTRSNMNSKPRAQTHAHEVGSWTSGMAVWGQSVVTRGGDGKVKVWDVRQMAKAVVERGGLKSGSVHTGVIFDVEGKGVITGVANDTTHETHAADAADADEGVKAGGSIVVLDEHTLNTVKSIPCTSVPIRLHWSHPTNQLFATHRNGSLTIHYSPTHSTKGILLPLSRPPPTTSTTSSPSTYTIDTYPITPDNLPLSESAKRRKLAKDRHNPSITLKPLLPLSGRGKGGRIGAAATQHVVQSVFGVPQDLNEDPREALLRYATKQDRAEAEAEGEEEGGGGGGGVGASVEEESTQEGVFQV
ncbi:uncharacterized protein SPSC_05482 [Sporisorium scitamineum]|uniref:Uncharacterized protein n=2 Tax=Sporisorium scitamineum TaxID=49012 RepID=A0A127ZHL6_9BASI|nr:uncharacterized protein SPSC_05482 [Sporisorium scitamineum]